MRILLKRLSLKISPEWKRNQINQINQIQEAQGSKDILYPIQDKPKEKQAKTHTNQTNKE